MLCECVLCTLASGFIRSIQSGTSQPDAFITFAIARSCSTSASVKKVTALPGLPALPVRPMRWMYETVDCGKSKLTTRETPLKSIPRAISSVAMRTQTWGREGRQTW